MGGAASSEQGYVAEKALGAGAFGQVELVRNSEGKGYARKCFPIAETGLRKDSIVEMSAYALSADIPGMVHSAGAYVDGPSLCVLSDLYDGSVAELLDHGMGLEDRVRLADRVFRTCMVALRMLHARGVLHLDVKPANILHRGDGEVALADMGLAYFTSCEGSIRHKQSRGSPKYFAPEVREGIVCKESDYASAALTVLAILTGKARSYPTLLQQYGHKFSLGISTMAYLHAEVVDMCFTISTMLIPALDTCLMMDPRARHGGALRRYLRDADPAPAVRDFPATDQRFAGLVGWYRSIHRGAESGSEVLTAFCKLLDLAWRLYARGIEDEGTYRALYAVVVKSYSSSRDPMPSLFPGETGVQVAQRELAVLDLVGRDLNICGSDSRLLRLVRASASLDEVFAAFMPGARWVPIQETESESSESESSSD